MKKTIQKIVFIFTTVFLISQNSFSVTHPRPSKPRNPVNLLSSYNPTFSGSTNWTLGSAVYDATVTRTAGTGSAKFGTPSSTALVSAFIPVTPGKTYTYAAYMRTSTWPTFINTFVTSYNSSQQFIRNELNDYQGTTVANDWQEIVRVYVAKPGEAYIKIKMFRPTDAPVTTGNIWVDDFYVGEGIGFQQPASLKTEFNGSVTKVDDLGNFQVYRNGQWVDFFPICMYQDDTRSNWTLYSQQGFNTAMWCNDQYSVNKAQLAVSTFNPAGMMAGIQLAPYTSPEISTETPRYNDLVMLESELTAINNAGLMDNVLLYYWDNENVWEEWTVPNAVLNRVKQLDVDSGQNRMHPIYGLQGHEGVTRTYKNLTDICGDYITGNINQFPYENNHGIIIQDYIEEQPNMAAFGQINLISTAGEMRRRVYDILIAGGKGFGFFRDGGTQGGDVTQRGWWASFPTIRAEIDQLLPIIKQPHWTTWSVTSSTNPIQLGTRDYNNEGYIIAVNDINSPITTTIILTGLGYTPTSVKNYFTGATVTTVANSRFTVTIPAYGSAVYRLPRPVTYSLATTANPSGKGTISPSSGTFAAGAQVILRATPISGYVFSSWSGSVTTSSNPVTITMNGNKVITASFIASTATSTPVSRWKFDEGSGTIADDSIGNTNGALQNGPIWSAGKSNYALQYDGVNDSVLLGNSTSELNITSGGLTIEAWCMLYSTGSHGIYAKGVSDGTGQGVMLAYMSSKFTFQVGNGTTMAKAWTTATNYALNTWYHVTGVWDGSNLRIYINGEEAGPAVSCTGQINYKNISDTYRPRIGVGWGTSGYPWHGKIDAVSIYNVGLGEAEIYNHSQIKTPVNNWKFAEGTGTTTDDSIGNVNGVLQGPIWSTGKSNYALQFDGVNDSVLLGDSTSALNITSVGLTIEAWCMLYSTGTHGIYAKGVSDGTGQGVMLAYMNSKFTFQVGNGTTMAKVWTTATNYSLNTWYHVTGVWDGSNLRIYVNGEEAGPAVSCTGQINYKNISDTYRPRLGVGWGTSGYPWHGKIDGVAIFNEGLSAVDILDDYTTVSMASINLPGQLPAAEVNSLFKLGEVYAYPNPAKGGVNPTIHIECGLADLVEIKIHNLAGELINNVQLAGSDYKIADNKYSYEYQWDCANNTSGVYVYLIRAQKGSETIKAMKKIAIIK